MAGFASAGSGKKEWAASERKDEAPLKFPSPLKMYFLTFVSGTSGLSSQGLKSQQY